MTRVLLYASGTLGDHFPFIALGRALRARGFKVKMVINQAMHDYSERAGLEAVSLSDIERGPEEAREHAWAWNHWHNPWQPRRSASKESDLQRYITQARELIDLCREADLLLATSIRTLGYVAHHATGIPWLTVSMNPSSYWWPENLQDRMGHLQSFRSQHQHLYQLTREAVSALGIQADVPPWSPGWLHARHTVLASSPHLYRPDLDQLQPTSRIEMTGFWFYEDQDWSEWEPGEALRDFCRRQPLALSFSSQPLENPAQILALHVEAAARLQIPLLVQRGWAGFSENDLPAETDTTQVMFADFLPHDWLFTHAAAAIQHGGIGSIARALRQGCPLLIEPFGNDQLFNAIRVARLGAGVAIHPFHATVDGLVRALDQEVLADECRATAEVLSNLLIEETGLETAVQLIQRFLDRYPAEGKKSAHRVEALLDEASLHLFVKESSLISASPPQPAFVPHEGIVPKILHQTWKDRDLPPDLDVYRRTWETQHPDWEHRLWTDADNRNFVGTHYPWFLSIYESYPEKIMVVDAVRYFILHHFGGVYADLDYESFRPLGPLLEGKSLVLTSEPEVHLNEHFGETPPFSFIISNALMASVPAHPFWEHVFRQLIASHRDPNPLEATGPFFLTRAVGSYPHTQQIHIYPPEKLSPVSSTVPWLALPHQERSRITENSYAVHHWMGSWWRQGAAIKTAQAKVSLLVAGETLLTSTFEMDRAREFLAREQQLPLISCLMVTADRPDLARRAIRCFQKQTYPYRELVIVDDGEDLSLQKWVETFDEGNIFYHRLPREGRTLGDLRNLSVLRSAGSYVSQWDDDDLSDPQRLELQMATLLSLDADACFLERQQLWWPAQNRLALSVRRIWEGSFVCRKTALPLYPSLRRGEDTPTIDRIVSEGKIVLLDMPQLFTYVYHGANTFDAEHWERHWLLATETYQGSEYHSRVRLLERRLELKLASSRGPVQRPKDSLPPVGVVVQPAYPQVHSGRTVVERGTNPEDVVGNRQKNGVKTLSRVLILTPLKDAVPFITRFLENLNSLTFPHGLISVAFLESDSIDGTYGLMEQHIPLLDERFVRARLFKHDYLFRPDGPRWDPEIQRHRRAVLAKSRNRLLSAALCDEDWVLWMDVDISRVPPDLIEMLVSSGKEIVVPHCISESTGDTYDLNTFKIAPGAESSDWKPFIIDGLLQPPKGFKRLYLSELRQFNCVEVDAVGGTALLVKADLHREGLIFPPFSYQNHIETEGLAFMARDMGSSCWGMPNLEIYHP